MTITEPMTMLTDYLIMIVAWWFAAKLAFSPGNVEHLSRRAWGFGLFFTGLAALLGGTSHGFALYLDDAAQALIWKGTVYSIGLSMLFVVFGTVRGTPLSSGSRNVLHTVNALVFLVYAYWMIDHDDFLYVIYDYVPALVIIAGTQAWALIDHRSDSAKWLIPGVAVSILGAAIQQSDINLHPHFNHNDLYHVVQLAGLYLLYRGARELRDP